MVYYSNCKFWYHDCSFPISSDLSLKQSYLVCSNCITELFHKFFCLFYLLQPMNINTFCDISDDKVNHNDVLNFNQHSSPQLTEKNTTNHYVMTMPNQMSKRGFLNKKSNCWVSSPLQVLHYSPLPHCLAISKELFAETLHSIFLIMTLFQNLLAIDDKIKVYCFTILGGIGHTTYFHVDEKVLSSMRMIRKLDSEVNKTDQMKFFVCWMESNAST